MRLLTLTTMLLLVLAGSARADDETDDDPGFNMLAVDMGIGALPIEGARTLTMSLGLGLEHPVFRVTRVFGEYDWLWLTRQAARPTDAMEPLERHGTGHRVSLGLRRELTATGANRFRVFLDGELGVSCAITNDNLSGVSTLPGGFLGLRLGYDAYTSRDESPSRTLEFGVLLRAIAIEGGVGFAGGLAMAWGS